MRTTDYRVPSADPYENCSERWLSAVGQLPTHPPERCGDPQFHESSNQTSGAPYESSFPSSGRESCAFDSRRPTRGTARSEA
jgi:hypothetical protein